MKKLKKLKKKRMKILLGTICMELMNLLPTIEREAKFSS